MLHRYKAGLTALFAKVHELQSEPIQNRMMALEIQEELLRRIGGAERKIRRSRLSNKSCKAALGKRITDIAESDRLKKLLAAGEEKIEQQKTLILALRSIGDAIVFVYGDRWDLKKMVEKEDAGFLSGKRGTRLERKVLRLVFEKGGTAVMNDLTHTMRHGDITVFRPDVWPPGEGKFLLLEMKSGNGGSRQRGDRQLAAINDVLGYLETGKKEEDGFLWVRESLQSDPAHHFDSATRLVKQLPAGGSVTEEVEPGLHYSLLDVGCTPDAYEGMFPFLAGRASDFILFSVNDCKKVHLGYYPFPLCFRDPEVLYHFYNGSFVMMICADLAHINAAAQHHGLSVKRTKDDHFPLHVVPVGQHSFLTEEGFMISFHPLGRLAAEFLRLDWWIENMVLAPVGEAYQQALAEANKRA